MKTELLPCPFCGDPDPYDPEKREAELLWYIECSNCTAEIFARSEDGVVEQWNKRACKRGEGCD